MTVETEPDGSTISTSGGQGGGVVWVATLQTGGGAGRWLTRWRTLLTTTTLLSQRAKSSLLWSGPCLESLMGHGLARIPCVDCDNRGGAAAGVAPRRTLRRAWRGRKWRERPPAFWRWCATGQGRWCTPKFTISPPLWGTPHHLSRGGNPFRMAFRHWHPSLQKAPRTGQGAEATASTTGGGLRPGEAAQAAATRTRSGSKQVPSRSMAQATFRSRSPTERRARA